MEVGLKEHMRKFTLAVGDNTWKELVKEAKTIDISVQELIRSHIIPFWLKNTKNAQH